jgi:hypothetical protein
MDTAKPTSKPKKLSWMDILFASLSVVIPILLQSLSEVVNDPEVEVKNSQKFPGTGILPILKGESRD